LAFISGRLTQGGGERFGREFANGRPDAKALDALGPEGLVAKERLDQRGDTSPETGARRAGAAVVAGSVDAREEPRVVDGVDGTG
jgi:hypothetical protein